MFKISVITALLGIGTFSQLLAQNRDPQKNVTPGYKASLDSFRAMADRADWWRRDHDLRLIGYAT